jgi:large subunit ribosomal protein L14e
MIEIGRLIVKLAGRDAGQKGVIVEILDNNYVLIDGQVRRRKCNILHIEPLNKKIKINDKATHEEVIKALKEEKIEIKEKKKKETTNVEKPKKQRKGKKKKESTKETKPVKKEEKQSKEKTEKK